MDSLYFDLLGGELSEPPVDSYPPESHAPASSNEPWTAPPLCRACKRRRRSRNSPLCARCRASGLREAEVEEPARSRLETASLVGGSRSDAAGRGGSGEVLDRMAFARLSPWSGAPQPGPQRGRERRLDSLGEETGAARRLESPSLDEEPPAGATRRQRPKPRPGCCRRCSRLLSSTRDTHKVTTTTTRQGVFVTDIFLPGTTTLGQHVTAYSHKEDIRLDDLCLACITRAVEQELPGHRPPSRRVRPCEPRYAREVYRCRRGQPQGCRRELFRHEVLGLLKLQVLMRRRCEWARCWDLHRLLRRAWDGAVERLRALCWCINDID